MNKNKSTVGIIYEKDVYRIKTIQHNQTTTDLTKKDPTKILLINNVDDFDKFTDIYGEPDNNNMYINWINVADDYKGFKLENTNQLSDQRFSHCYYNGQQYYSWWDNEYYFDDSIIFVK
jgi:hypothetical protein